MWRYKVQLNPKNLGYSQTGSESSKRSKVTETPKYDQELENFVKKQIVDRENNDDSFFETYSGSKRYRLVFCHEGDRDPVLDFNDTGKSEEYDEPPGVDEEGFGKNDFEKRTTLGSSSGYFLYSRNPDVMTKIDRNHYTNGAWDEYCYYEKRGDTFIKLFSEGIAGGEGYESDRTESV